MAQEESKITIVEYGPDGDPTKPKFHELMGLLSKGQEISMLLGPGLKAVFRVDYVNRRIGEMRGRYIRFELKEDEDGSNLEE